MVLWEKSCQIYHHHCVRDTQSPSPTREMLVCFLFIPLELLLDPIAVGPSLSRLRGRAGSTQSRWPNTVRSRVQKALPRNPTILTPNCCGKNPVKFHHCVRDTQSQINKEREVFILARISPVTNTAVKLWSE